MKNHILPVLRHKLVADITVQDICEVLDPLWEKKTTIASRIRGQLEAIFTLAKREGVYIGENPATWKGNLEAYFPPPARVHRREHQKAYTIEALADQLKASLRVDRPVHNAFVFGVLTATRQAEFNDAKWSEIDFEHKVWTVPPERRKDRKPEPFRVPLSDQAIALPKRITPESEYIFSGSYYNNRSVARGAVRLWRHGNNAWLQVYISRLVRARRRRHRRGGKVLDALAQVRAGRIPTRRSS